MPSPPGPAEGPRHQGSGGDPLQCGWHPTQPGPADGPRPRERALGKQGQRAPGGKRRAGTSTCERGAGGSRGREEFSTHSESCAGFSGCSLLSFGLLFLIHITCFSNCSRFLAFTKRSNLYQTVRTDPGIIPKKLSPMCVCIVNYSNQSSLGFWEFLSCNCSLYNLINYV